jgi:predicted MFS family arabinose efflux permease
MRTAVSPPEAGINRRLRMTLYVVAAFLYWAALYLYVPTLPLYAQSKSNSLQLIGIALSMYGLGHIFIRLPVGIAAGWLGQHKQLIIGGLILVGLGAFIMGTSSNISQLIVGRAITGVAAGTWVPLTLAFCSLFPPEEGIRATAMLTFVASVARLLSSSATGSLNDLGGYSLPFFLAAGAAAMAIVVVLPTREMVSPPQRVLARDVSQVIRRRDVLFPSLLSALAQHADWAVTFGFLPLLARQLGATNLSQSMLLTVYFLMFILGNLGTTFLIRWASARLLVRFAFVLLSAGIGLTALAASLPVIFAAQAGIGLAQGICHPALMGMSIRYVTGSERATAMGLHQAVYAVGMFTGPWLSGMLASILGIRPIFGSTAIMCLTIGLFINSRLGRET